MFKKNTEISGKTIIWGILNLPYLYPSLLGSRLEVKNKQTNKQIVHISGADFELSGTKSIPWGSSGIELSRKTPLNVLAMTTKGK